MTGRSDLSVLAGDPSRAALFTDFDGSLSEIVEDPEAATGVPGAIDALAALAGRLRTVGVISGRPMSFLERTFPPALDLAGLYGLERRRGATREDHPDAAAWRAVVDDVVAAAQAWAPPGVLVEHKGPSLTIHHRTAPAEITPQVMAFAADQAQRTGLELRPAKQSVELHPPIHVDKGTTLTELAVGCTAVAFIGDDVGDLPAFDALDRLAADGIATVKVGVRSLDEAGSVLARADVVADGPRGAVALLQDLLATLDAR